MIITIECLNEVKWLGWNYAIAMLNEWFVFSTDLVVVVLVKLDATSLVDEVVAANHVDPSFQQNQVDLLASSDDGLEPVVVHVARYDD